MSMERRMIGGGIILAATAAVVLGAKKSYKPYVPDAPAFRQEGGAQAPVTLVEFSDFQCPNCRAAVGVIKGLLNLYDGKLRVIFKYFPLRMHLRSQTAARAAQCAGEQGKFWEMHDLLFDKQEQWSVPWSAGWSETDPDWPAAYAKALKLDEAKWAACYHSPETAHAVDADEKEGENLWVGGTPTVFINGKRMVGARQISQMAPLWIDKQLRR